jgi:vancomycin resistance protein YoaR
VPRATRRAVAVALSVAAGAFLLAVGERLLFSGKVMPGVAVDGVALGGDGELDAYVEISALAAQLEAEPIRATVGDTRLVLAPGQIGFDVDELATLRAARQAARTTNPIEQTVGALLRRVRSDTVPLVVSWDAEALEDIIDQWFVELADGVTDPGLRFEGTEVIEVVASPGRGIDRDEARRAVEEQLRRAQRHEVELEIRTVEPRIGPDAVAAAAARARQLLAQDIVVIANDQFLVLRPEGLASALGTRPDGDELELVIDHERLVAALGDDFARLVVPPVDARFAVDGTTVSIVPHENGRGPDLDALSDAILAGERRIETPVVDVVPERTTEWAKSLRIDGLVSTFTTEFPPGQPRVENIRQAAAYLDGTIVMPGEVFSFNDTVGPRTEARGFVQAPVYYGEFTEDIGGGVSQVATTLFNAVFYGGYEDVTHKPHTIYFSRYPRVIEATVNYPSLDLKFRNDTDAGVLIKAWAGSSSITISFYGNNGGRQVRLEGPFVLEEIPVTDEYVAWPLLPVGEEQLVERGIPGFVAEAFRIIEAPGRETTRERFVWRYAMLPNKILRGTAEPTTTTPETTAPPPEVTEPPPQERPRRTTTTVPTDTTSAPVEAAPASA